MWVCMYNIVIYDIVGEVSSRCVTKEAVMEHIYNTYKRGRHRYGNDFSVLTERLFESLNEGNEVGIDLIGGITVRYKKV